MKWVELGKFFPPDMGGIERVSEACARIVSAKGHDVRVIVFSETKASDDVVADIGRVSRYAPWLTLASAPLSPGYVTNAVRAMRSADVVHVHMPNPLGALAVRLHPGKYQLIVHWHSDVISQSRSTYLLYKRLETALLRRADKIIVTTSAYADASEALRRWIHKCVEVPLSTSDPQLPDAPTVPRTLLACGRLVPYKGFDVLIRAMALLPETYRLRICGTGPLMQSLQQQIAAAGLQHRVEMLGFVSDARLAELMAEADVFCMPSITKAEAFGVSAIEAFAAGLPLVSSTLLGSGLTAINRHGITGLQFPVGDAAALAAAITRICEDRPFRASLAHGAREEFLARYTTAAYEKRFADACFGPQPT